MTYTLHGFRNFDKPADPLRVEALCIVGRAELPRGDILKARDCFVNVTYVAPNDPRGYYYLAWAYDEIAHRYPDPQTITVAVRMIKDCAQNLLRISGQEQSLDDARLLAEVYLPGMRDILIFRGEKIYGKLIPDLDERIQSILADLTTVPRLETDSQ